MQVAIVINGNAGSLIGRDDVSTTLAERLAAGGFGARFFGPEHGTLPERVAAARDSGADMVAVAGGDGTIASAAQLLAGTDIPLAILPFGTMNLLARDLAIPLDLEGAIAAIADGDVRSIDVGSVNGRVFLCNSVIGIAAILQRQRERDRHMPQVARWWRLGVASLKALTRYEPRRFGVHFGHRVHRLKTRTLVVSVNAYDPTPLNPLHRGRLDGGHLVLYANRPPGAPAGIDVFGIEQHHTHRLAISSPRRRIRVMSDGELHLLDTPLRYRIHHRALKVMVPATPLAEVVRDWEDNAAPEPIPATD